MCRRVSASIGTALLADRTFRQDFGTSARRVGMVARFWYGRSFLRANLKFTIQMCLYRVGKAFTFPSAEADFRARMAKEAEKIFDEMDVQIIAGLCLGMTQEAIGNWICTPIFKAGVSERTVRTRIADNREAIDRCAFRIGVAFKRKEEEFEEITKAQYREKLAKLRSKGLRVKELGLDAAISNPTSVEHLSLGVKVAEALEDRDLGKATQVVASTGEVRHDHYIWTSETPAQLMGQEYDMRESQKLLEAVPKDVLEAEVVADA